MTIILAAATRDYILLSSDRCVTKKTGRIKTKIEVVGDDECKLVNWNNIAVIGYSGLAFVGKKRIKIHNKKKKVERKFVDRPTHEWVAVKLARANCNRISCVIETLINEANKAFVNNCCTHIPHAFFIAHWEHYPNEEILKPVFTVITNALNDKLQWIKPQKEFYYFERLLKDDEAYMEDNIGQPLSDQRYTKLRAKINELSKQAIDPDEMMRLLNDEIIYMSNIEKNKTVNDKILCINIPRKTVENLMLGDQVFITSSMPNINDLTFTYLQDGNQPLKQVGPSCVSGDKAWIPTTVKSENGHKSAIGLNLLYSPNPVVVEWGKMSRQSEV